MVALTPPPVAVPDAAAAYAPTVGLATAASPTASITLIGGFRVHRAGEDVTPTGAPATAVKRLALSGRVLHVEELAADLWPDTDVSTGRVRLRNVVRRARTHVEDLIVRDGEYLRIGDDVTIDTEVLPNELSRLRELAVTDPVRALRELREVLPATGLEVLPGEPEDELLEATRARVRRDALRGLDLTAELASRAGDPAVAAGALQAAIELDPYGDARYVMAADLLGRHGHPSAALRLLSQARQVAEELGVPVSRAVEELERGLRG